MIIRLGYHQLESLCQLRKHKSDCNYGKYIYSYVTMLTSACISSHRLQPSSTLNIIQSQLWMFLHHFYSWNVHFRSVFFSKKKQYKLLKCTGYILERTQRRHEQKYFICLSYLFVFLLICNNWNIAKRIFIKFDNVISYAFQSLLKSNIKYDFLYRHDSGFGAPSS